MESCGESHKSFGGVGMTAALSPFGGLAFVLLVACGGSPADLRDGRAPAVDTVLVAAITLSLPSDGQLSIGSTAQATAVLRDAGGAALPSQQLEWSSDNTNVATVSATGGVAATGAGATSIHARLGTIQGSAVVTVAPRETAVEFIVSGLPSGAAAWVRASQLGVGQPTHRDSIQVTSDRPVARFTGLQAGPVTGVGDTVDFGGTRYAAYGSYSVTALDGATVRPQFAYLGNGQTGVLAGEMRYSEIAKFSAIAKILSPGQAGANLDLANLLLPSAAVGLQLRADSTTLKNDVLTRYFSTWAPVGEYRLIGFDWTTIFFNGQYQKGWVPSPYSQPVVVPRGGASVPVITYSPAP